LHRHWPAGFFVRAAVESRWADDASADTFPQMTRMMLDVADDLCDGRLVARA